MDWAKKKSRRIKSLGAKAGGNITLGLGFYAGIPCQGFAKAATLVEPCKPYPQPT